MPAIPRELLVFLASMMPVGEMRAGIPLGLLLGMSPEAAFFWAELGNILIIVPLLKILGPVSDWLRQRSAWCERTFSKLFDHTRAKHTTKFEKMGEMFILALAAIPFPGTGAWTAALVAFLFGISYWRSLLLIFIGNIVCGILVTTGFGGVMDLIIKISRP
jgi:uncharacterized membrane protein